MTHTHTHTHALLSLFLSLSLSLSHNTDRDTHINTRNDIFHIVFSPYGRHRKSSWLDLNKTKKYQLPDQPYLSWQTSQPDG